MLLLLVYIKASQAGTQEVVTTVSKSAKCLYFYETHNGTCKSNSFCYTFLCVGWFSFCGNLRCACHNVKTFLTCSFLVRSHWRWFLQLLMREDRLNKHLYWYIVVTFLILCYNHFTQLLSQVFYFVKEAIKCFGVFMMGCNDIGAKYLKPCIDKHRNYIKCRKWVFNVHSWMVKLSISESCAWLLSCPWKPSWVINIKC